MVPCQPIAFNDTSTVAHSLPSGDRTGLLVMGRTTGATMGAQEREEAVGKQSAWHAGDAPLRKDKERRPGREEPFSDWVGGFTPQMNSQWKVGGAVLDSGSTIWGTDRQC